MSDITLFKPSESYQALISINQVQFCTIQNLQKQNTELQEKIKHLEDLLCKIVDAKIANK